MNDPVALTKKLLAYKTVNPPGNEDASIRFLGELLQENGYAVDYPSFAPGRTSLIARSDGKGEPLILSGHIDTVPLGNTDWTKDPFAGPAEGDKLFGRGVSDMKSGVAAITAAALKAGQDKILKKALWVVITASEETACTGAEFLVKKGHLKGKAGAILVAEPTGNYPCLGHKGATWVEAGTSGKTAHASMPEEGDNAIYKAAAAITRLKDFTFKVQPHPLLGEPKFTVGTMGGGLNINSVPDQARFTIDIRTIPELTTDKVLDSLQQVLGDEVSLKLLINAPAIASEADDPFVQAVFGIMEPVLGTRPEPRSVPYFTDGSVFKDGLGSPPIIILGPGEADQAHKTDEFCYISKIKQAAEAYLQIIKKWCRG